MRPRAEDGQRTTRRPSRIVFPDGSVGTGTGHVLGSRDYMAPEQILDSRGAESRADVYSLGCTFYYLLTATPPILNRPYENFLAYTEPMPRPKLSALAELVQPAIPDKLMTLLDRMTAKSPEQRPSSVAEVAEATKPFASGSDLVQTYVSRWSRSRSMAQRCCATLEVDASASPQEIDEAYRQLAVENHPDLNPDDPDAAKKFRGIQDAYETLREPQRHKRKGAFHTAASAFLTVDVVTKSPRRIDETAAGGIGLPLISMAIVFCVFFVIVTAVILLAADEDDWNADDDSRPVDDPNFRRYWLRGVFCLVTFLFFAFIFVVLKHSGP